MQLEQQDKELAAIGASIGANCRPCIEHHIAAGREAGLSDSDLSEAVAIATAVRQEAVDQLSAHIDELLGRDAAPTEKGARAETSRAGELVALGASVGANAHALLRLHIATALDAGLRPAQVRAAVKMAEHVQRRAAEITADKAVSGLDELTTAEGSAPAGVPAGARLGSAR